MVHRDSQDADEDKVAFVSNHDWSDFTYLDGGSCIQDVTSGIKYDCDAIGKLNFHLSQSGVWKIQSTLNITEELLDFSHYLSSCKAWQNVSMKYGSPTLFCWKDSKIQICGVQFNVPNASTNDSIDDDYELYEAMDFLSLTESHPTQQHDYSFVVRTSEEENLTKVQTADEVIEEIEEILQNADEQDVAFDIEMQERTGIILGFNKENFDGFENRDSALSTHLVMSHPDEVNNESSKALKLMTVPELNEKLGGLEISVKFLSESLLTELNLRDELLYVKEIRNKFITKLLEVQYKQEQFQHASCNKSEGGRFKRGKLPKSLSMSSAAELSAPGRFLTTVIPFEKGTIPSLENLQALIRVLEAIKQDSNEVPALITDYILKVLFPASQVNTLLSL